MVLSDFLKLWADLAAGPWHVDHGLRGPIHALHSGTFSWDNHKLGGLSMGFLVKQEPYDLGSALGAQILKTPNYTRHLHGQTQGGPGSTHQE